MKTTWTVVRAELRGYLDHPTAYVLVIAFLALALFLSIRQMYLSGLASLRPLFDLLPWLLTVFVPAVTMRALAEERRGRTLEWLLAQPVSEGELILGKLVGNWLIVLLALAGTLPAAAALVVFTEADPGILVGQYAGAGLMALELAAIGLWASSVTRNQITAFILGTAVGLFLLMLGTPVVTMGIPSLFAEAASRLSLLGHFENVTRGVIDLRDVLYFVSAAALFSLLAYVSVIRERLSASQPAFKRLRLGVVAVAALVIVANLLGGYVRGRLDLTRGNLYTLSEGTRQILGDLRDVVSIGFYVSSELPPEVQVSVRDVRDVLADIRRASNGMVRVEEVNPDSDPSAAQEARDRGIQQIDFNVLRNDEFTVRSGWFGLALMYADQAEAVPVIDRTDDLEFRLLSAISRMTTVERPIVTFLTGYGAAEPEEFQNFSGMLSERYEIAAVNLEEPLPEALDPATTGVIVVAAPNLTIDPAGVDLVRRYLDGGGGGLFLMDRNQVQGEMLITQEVVTGLEPLLEERGIRVVPGIVYDLLASERIQLPHPSGLPYIQAYPYWPIVFPAESRHATTRDLQRMSLGWANPVEAVEGSGAVPLWITTEAAGLQGSGTPVAPGIEGQFSQNREDFEVRTIAAASGGGEEAGDGSRVVVVGDVDFLTDNFVGSSPQNLFFAANAVDWLAQDEALISIRSKNRMPPALVFPSDGMRTAVRWGSLAGAPILLLLLGVVRVGGRRRRAERRWREVVG